MSEKGPKEDPLRKELARQIRSLLRDERLTIPGKINFIGDLLLSPLLALLALKPLVLEILSGLEVQLDWLKYTGQSDLLQFLQSVFWVLLFIAVWVGCILAFVDYSQFQSRDEK